MQYEVNTSEEYLSVLEDDWRKEKLLELRELLLLKEYELKEGIQYKMLSYHDEHGLLFCLNAQKGYVSLYIGDISKVDPDGELLKGANLGKGCIRFTKSVAITDTRVDEFITKAVQFSKEGKDVGC